jgi:hypothetical protein
VYYIALLFIFLNVILFHFVLNSLFSCLVILYYVKLSDSDLLYCSFVVI